jgi:hypothetical protein
MCCDATILIKSKDFFSRLTVHMLASSYEYQQKMTAAEGMIDLVLQRQLAQKQIF